MSDQSEQINELATALAKAQARIANAAKDGENPHFRSSYATLASVWDACRAPLGENGLSVIQAMSDSERGFVLVTTLAHSSGQWMVSRYPVLPTKNDPQGLGSALTYARRYSLAAMVGVSPSDDDGEAATGRGRNGFDSLDRVPQRTAPEHKPKVIAAPAQKPKAALPPLPDEVTHIPQEILQWIAPLRPLTAVPLKSMALEDLELVIEQVKKFAPKFTTPEGKAWLTAIEGTATHRRGELESMGDDSPSYDESTVHP